MTTIDKQAGEDFFATVKEKLIKAKKQMELCAKCKQEYRKKFDKIRKEIKSYDNFILCANGQKGIHIDAVLEIIDQCIAEMED